VKRLKLIGQADLVLQQYIPAAALLAPTTQKPEACLKWHPGKS